MSEFILNLFFVVAWVGLTQEITLGNLVTGFILGYLLLRFTHGFSKGRIFPFIGFFIRELFVANFRVAYEVIVPTSMQTMRPGIIAVPLDLESAEEITLMANFITLTPGTLSMDVSDDCKTLFVHAMHIDDAEAFKRDLKERLETRIAEVWT